jgi:hypothetical protein
MPLNPYQGLKQLSPLDRDDQGKLYRDNATESLSGIETNSEAISEAAVAQGLRVARQCH